VELGGGMCGVILMPGFSSYSILFYIEKNSKRREREREREKEKKQKQKSKATDKGEKNMLHATYKISIGNLLSLWDFQLSEGRRSAFPSKKMTRELH
jgi:hypothetical protein